MTTCTELLPDHEAWSKSIYKAVKKDAARVLAGCHVRVASSTPEAEVQKLLTELDRESKDEVLKHGAKLGRQRVEMIENERRRNGSCLPVSGRGDDPVCSAV
jgi:hypothetical protein